MDEDTTNTTPLNSRLFYNWCCHLEEFHWLLIGVAVIDKGYVSWLIYYVWNMISIGHVYNFSSLQFANVSGLSGVFVTVRFDCTDRAMYGLFMVCARQLRQ
jgi:hypothetical protein